MRQEELSLEEQVERIRRKRAGQHDNTKIRMVLNTLFLALAAVGLAMYFFGGDNHVPALCVIAAGMVLKVIEFILRIV
ncbi:MAG: hypothetical protein IJ219_01190 [Bacteroidaceae bacterium]|nr:hypothetical protein [Bacteroidaceae bacterium]MBQ9170916.1 hypothetical protein [Bacteroidaceae bacterium]MBQ9293528.1 hypothetical protein [Bacteroidaceae bacterium]